MIKPMLLAAVALLIVAEMYRYNRPSAKKKGGSQADECADDGADDRYTPLYNGVHLAILSALCSCFGSLLVLLFL